MQELERIRLENLIKNDKINIHTLHEQIIVLNEVTENLYFERIVKPIIPRIV